jgi:hypothetical protein
MTLYFCGRPFEVPAGQRADWPCWVPVRNVEADRLEFLWSEQLFEEPWGAKSFFAEARDG